ncbi:PilZ-like domain-containing protein [Geomesophilobacter sediminis]|uniref:DUF5634 family protein n=1 Tax=Geomesophilobacter sediminis TaxID=2798584 RepID=A0A8J7M1L0_9BACT|nr:PilZ-like domain-containing protein [Geomesophilobacter sediminis]MBJ6726991.1 DUF5634 family protein [Geomesophilobacter sediminis]
MTQDFEEYARYFPPGIRVRVGIPLETGRMFQEWGVVAAMDDDLLELRLSRDLLPVEARLEIGRAVELRVVHREKVRFCRGVVVTEDIDKNCSIRLIEDVVIDEPREFYRHEVFLPVEYRVPFHQDVNEIKKEWQEKHRDREFAYQQPSPDEPDDVVARREALRRELEAGPRVPPQAANMSGGGLRFIVAEVLEPGTLVALTIYLPGRKVLHIVGEVVARQQLRDGTHFSTALRFRFIDERDRDAIVAYISAEQLAHLAEMRERMSAEYQAGSFFGNRQYWIAVTVGLAIIVGAAWYLTHAILESQRRGEKHIIEQVFEDGIKKYLRQRD